MRTLSNLFIILPVLILFGACQQEVDLVLPDQNHDDSTYLSRVYALDTTKPAGSDTIFVSSYTYDQQKRLSQIVLRDRLGGTVWPDEIYTMHYSGNDTLPFRYDVISGNSHASSFYSYSGNFVATDSTSGFNGINNYKQVTQFSSLRPGWYLLKSVRETDLNPGVFETVDSTIFSRTYTSGNIISTVDSVWSSGLLDYVESSQYQYDQNKGPLRRFQLFFNGYYESAVPTISFPSLNNITSESNFNSISGSLILSASHTIATSGYPAVSRINGMIEFNKYIYEYINL